MENKNYIGEYNNIYLLKEGKKISGIFDPAHRKKPVKFQEIGFDDLKPEPRKDAEFFIGSAIPVMVTTTLGQDLTRQIEIEGNQFIVTGNSHASSPMGFGIGYEYYTVKTDTVHSAVLLTVKLPELVRYRIQWNPLDKKGSRFILPENITITVMTSLPWNFENSTFVVETGSEEGKVSFYIESTITPNQVRDVVILVAKGHERDALPIRALCGKGFVPCFVLDNSHNSHLDSLGSFLENVPCRLILSIGLPLAQGIAKLGVEVVEIDALTDVSSEILNLLGQPPSKLKLIAPNKQEAYGPSLLLALHYEANLVLNDEQDGDLYLKDASGYCLKKWSLPDLLAVPLEISRPDEQPVLSRENRRELVICESNAADLLVCQAIGYAALRGCPIAFLSPITGGNKTVDLPDGKTGLNVLESEAAKAIPISLRAPNADSLTIFTCHLPLHLTPFPDSGSNKHWVDQYVIAHMPGQVASQLVPRFFKKEMLEAPPVPFSVVFDALGHLTDTEGRIYADKLADGLSYPIVLTAEDAHRDVLCEVLQRFDIDFVLLISHGEGNAIEDGLGNIITNKEVASWKLNGLPLIFNNSCTSWTTTGHAFLNAGARGLIGSLWPIKNSIATQIATHLGKQLHANETDDIPMLLSRAVRQVTTGELDAIETAASYIYVGLPGAQLLSRPIVSQQETVELLMRTFNALYGIFNEIISNGRPDLALIVQNVTTRALKSRFKDLLVPGELPLHLPWPMTQFSVLDLDFLFASADFNLGKNLLTSLPHENQRSVVVQMNKYLNQALHELVMWNERHDAHIGRREGERDAVTQKMGLPTGALGEMGFIRLAAGMTLESILPFIQILADLKEEELARFWLDMAAKLVTTPEDLSSDGSVSDKFLIQRIRNGIKQPMRMISVEDRDETETSIDILKNAVNKSELSNRFGIACLHLNDYERAAAFFETARDLAEPGSGFYANAISNLSNALRFIDKDKAIDGYYKAFAEQEKLQDYHNAMTTAANLVRIAARRRCTINEEIIIKTLAWADALDVPVDRFKHRSNLLGASACYYASRGKHDLAARACEEISHHLSTPFPVPEVAVHLNDLVSWYYEEDSYIHALKQAIVNAASFKKAQLPDVAARTYMLACDCALRAYTLHYNQRFLRDFLDCSQKFGEIFLLNSNIRKELDDKIDYVRETLESLWKQFANKGERELALQAYRILKVWDSKYKEPGWELLDYAYHPRNVEAIQTLAMNGGLIRNIFVNIDTDMRVTVEQTIERNDNNYRSEFQASLPGTVYSYWPLYDQTSALSLGGADVVAGTAVYSLRDGELKAIREKHPRALRTDGKATFLFQEIWGSRLFSYNVTILLAPGLIPIQFEITERNDSKPDAFISFNNEGCRIELKAKTNEDNPTQNQPWLAEVSLIFSKIPQLSSVLNDSSGPFSKKCSLDVYLLLLKVLMGRK